MFDGPECQQTKHSFGGQGYAWFPPIMPCFQSHISLEFLAESANGLLLYNGPLGPAQSGEQEDFIAVGELTVSKAQSLKTCTTSSLLMVFTKALSCDLFLQITGPTWTCHVQSSSRSFSSVWQQNISKILKHILHSRAREAKFHTQQQKIDQNAKQLQDRQCSQTAGDM